MKVETKHCAIQFSDGSEEYKEGNPVLILPEISTDTHYAVATDYCRPFMVERKYLK